ncbi:MAG: hypothetical protein AB1568_11430 [Thermodesulfobacteriota bacterium]
MKLRPHEWLLTGLDGGHPLAFLATLGTLRTATLAWQEEPAPTLRWAIAEGAWRPVLSLPCVTDKEILLAGLHDQLKKMEEHPAFAVGDNLNFTETQFRSLAATAQSRYDVDPIMADFLSAFACEAAREEKGELLADTAFRTMRGAGHQHFIKTMRELIANTTIEQLEASLFSQWRYEETGLSLRLDPADDRRYALRWKEPSGDPCRTERGANRLAVEALPFFPVQPVGRRLETTGFTTRPRHGTFLTWPIWGNAIRMEVVLSLLSLSSLQEERPLRPELAARGIFEIFRCQRITLGKYRNFTTATPV